MQFSFKIAASLRWWWWWWWWLYRCRRINSLTTCHRHQFERYCGTDAAEVMEQLLRRALNDPVFLRYRYRPHCASHTTTTATTQQTTFTSSTASVTSERPSTVDWTTNDELINLTSVENSTSVTVEAGSERWRTDVQFAKSGAENGRVTLNVLIVSSLLSVINADLRHY